MISGKFTLLAFLYFLQGIPYGLQSVYLPLYFKESSLPLTQISIFKLLLIPWLLKIFWAPLVDSYGTRRQWLLLSVGSLVVVSFVTALFIDPKQLLSLGVCLFLLNLFTSMLDVALDSVTVTILPPTDLPRGNAAQVIAYKIGTVTGGGFIAAFIKYFSWAKAITGLTAFYLYALLFVYLSPITRKLHKEDLRHRKKVKFNSILHLIFIPNIPEERQLTRRERKWMDEDEESESTEGSSSAGTETPSNSEDLDKLPLRIKGSKQEVLSQLSLIDQALKICSFPGTMWFLAFVFVYKLGEQGALNMLPMFMVDQGHSTEDVRFWTGTVGQTLSIMGSLAGGYILSQYTVPPYVLLAQLSWSRLVPMGLIMWIVALWKGDLMENHLSYVISLVLINVLIILSGLMTTVTFTAMMQCTRMVPWGYQATHYSALASAEVMGKLFFSSACGALVDIFGYQAAFLVFTVLVAVPIPMFSYFPKEMKDYMDDLTEPHYMLNEDNVNQDGESISDTGSIPDEPLDADMLQVPKPGVSSPRKPMPSRKASNRAKKATTASTRGRRKKTD